MTKRRASYSWENLFSIVLAPPMAITVWLGLRAVRAISFPYHLVNIGVIVLEAIS